MSKEKKTKDIVDVDFEAFNKDPVPCDACGVNLKHEGMTWKAVSFSITCIEGQSHPEHDRMMKVFGKDNFSFCSVCYLTALGVKPPAITEAPSEEDVAGFLDVVKGGGDG